MNGNGSPIFIHHFMYIRKIFNGELGILEGYKKFLSGGCSDTPIELLKLAGVDMSHTGPVEEALKFFEELLNEFEELA